MKTENTKKTEKTPAPERVVIKGFAGKSSEPEQTKTPTTDKPSAGPSKGKDKDRQSNPIRHNPEREGNADWDKDEELNNPDPTHVSNRKKK